MESCGSQSMKVRLKRTGGIAGMTKQWEIDFCTLPSEKVFEFKKLLEAANFFALGANLVSASQSRDQFCYELTVEEEGKKHTVQCAEDLMTKSMRNLLNVVLTFPLLEVRRKS